MKSSQTGMVLIGILLLMGVTMGLAVTQMSAWEGCSLQVTVLDAQTEVGISGAIIELDFVSWPAKVGDVDYTLATDGSGSASRIIGGGQYKLRITHPSYQTLEAGPILLVGTEQLVYKMQRATGPSPGGHTLDLYLMAPTGKPVSQGSVTLNGQQHSTDTEGRIRIYSLPRGTYQATFTAQWVEGTADLKSRTFTASVEMPAYDQAFTVYVSTGILVEGAPPPPPFEWERVKWVVLGLGAVGILGFALLYQGRGPELVDQLMGRR